MAKGKDELVYETKINCKNCQNEIDIQVPIGMPVKKYREKNKCSICKCPLK